MQSTVRHPENTLKFLADLMCGLVLKKRLLNRQKWMTVLGCGKNSFSTLISIYLQNSIHDRQDFDIGVHSDNLKYNLFEF